MTQKHSLFVLRISYIFLSGITLDIRTFARLLVFLIVTYTIPVLKPEAPNGASSAFHYILL